MMKIEYNVGFIFGLMLICLVPGQRIINGRKAKNGEVSHQVSLRNSQGNHVCGGSILNQNWVITAAHCLQRPVHTIMYNTLSKQRGNQVAVSKIFIHPKFRPTEYENFNDIALIRIATPMKLNQPNADRVKLPKQGDDPKPGLVVTVSGWGIISYGELFPTNSLQLVKVPIVDRRKCKKFYGEVYQKVNKAMICAGLENGGKDSCWGDSGGPATLDGVLVGIVSWGWGCAFPQFPGIYTRVGLFRNWITNITGI